MSKQSEEKRAYWRDVLERQRESGSSVRQFCREHQISEASFHSWKRKIAGHDRGDDASSESGDQKQPARRQVAKQTENAAVFIPVRVSAAGSNALEIVHPRGHVLRVPAVFDEGALQRVLEVLDQQGDR
jgi:transposase-like protein